MTSTITQLDAFTRQYIATALWASMDSHGEPLDGVYTIDDFAPETVAEIADDCRDFQEANAADIGSSAEQAGHDFWLTRCRHGAGFWDGDWPHDVGRRLTAASHAYGDCNLYVGGDGLIYLF